MGCLSNPSVRRASDRLRGLVHESPLRFDRTKGAWLKLESLQRTGSFKVRGALNAILAQAERGALRRVVAASAGNHGAGVAWAAQHVGVPAVIVVPLSAPEAKCARIRRYGAKIVRLGQNFDESLDHARALARSNGWQLIHAFDAADVIAGQGSIASELSALRPDVVVVPVGGGGLASGMGLGLASTGARLVGVQVIGLDAMARSLRHRPRLARPMPSVADGLRVRRVGRLTRQLCAKHLERIVMVSEQEVCRAMAQLSLDLGLRVEGAGAAVYAALDRVQGSRKCAVITGGNVDAAVMRHALERAGRATPAGRIATAQPVALAG